MSKKLSWAALALSATLGCESSQKTPYADNPLLMSREPLVQNGGAQQYAPGGWNRQTPPASGPAQLTRVSPAWPPPAPVPGQPTAVASAPKVQPIAPPKPVTEV